MWAELVFGGQLPKITGTVLIGIVLIVQLETAVCNFIASCPFTRTGVCFITEFKSYRWQKTGEIITEFSLS